MQTLALILTNDETTDYLFRKKHNRKKSFMAFYSDQCHLRVYANCYDSQNNGILEWNEIVGYDANGI